MDDIETTASWWSTHLPSILATLAAGFSAITAFLLLRVTRRGQQVISLLQIVERLESGSKRAVKRRVYSLERMEYGAWSDEERYAADTWGAELDLLGLLVHAKDIDVDAFFAMYGDVTIRSIYQLAPYINHERQHRGPQFLLPFGALALTLIDVWTSKAEKRVYPIHVGLPGRPDVRISPATLFEDTECAAFLRQNRRLRHSLPV